MQVVMMIVIWIYGGVAPQSVNPMIGPYPYILVSFTHKTHLTNVYAVEECIAGMITLCALCNNSTTGSLWM